MQAVDTEIGVCGKLKLVADQCNRAVCQLGHVVQRQLTIMAGCGRCLLAMTTSSTAVTAKQHGRIITTTRQL